MLTQVTDIMAEHKPKKKAYVIASRNLVELQDAVKDKPSYTATTICEIKIDRSDMSPEQKEIQAKNHWYREHQQEFHVRKDQIYSLVKKLAVEKILSGEKKDIKKCIYNEIYNTDIRIIATINKRDGYSSLSSNVEFGTQDEWGNNNENVYEYSDDMSEFMEQVQDCKYKNSFSANNNEYVLLEAIRLEARPYHFAEIDKIIKNQINKYVKENLTYCLKRDEVIIPQEYIDKGEEGIKEWREIKASKNKNNSIEKKILQQTVNEKKRFAFNSMCRMMDAITTATPINWAVPFVCVDGRYNKQRTNKLIRKIMDNKTRQFYIDITEEEIVEMFKEYWKEILMKAYNNVDKMSVKEEENK